MRRIQTRLKTRDRKQKTGNRLLLTEGVIPLRKNGQRDWATMTDDELVRFAKISIKEKGIGGRGELEKADRGLYQVLMKRGLLDRMGFEEKHRNWSSMTDGKLIQYAKKSIKEKGISRRTELQKADKGLYEALRKRGLLDKITAGRNQRKQRSWHKMKDEALIEFARRSFREKGINGRSELQKADIGLYNILRRRRLSDKVGFESKMRLWKDMGDEEIIELATRFMKENEINGRSELTKADPGLYAVLLRRGLLDKIGFEDKHRDWFLMSDTELIEHAERFMKEKGISSRSKLNMADPGLYVVLFRRGLLDKVDFEEKIRNKRPWTKMKDEEIIDYARRFMEENRINKRMKLRRADSGLYYVLTKRGLLDKVGLGGKRQKRRFWNKMNDEKIIEHVKVFMEKNGIRRRSELEKADKGLYDALRRRGLLDKIGFEEKVRKRRPWKKMKNEELIEHAKRFMEEEGINGRYELNKADRGLYQALRKRKLLNLVFSPIEKSASEKAIEQIINFTASFGEKR